MLKIISIIKTEPEYKGTNQKGYEYTLYKAYCNIIENGIQIQNAEVVSFDGQIIVGEYNYDRKEKYGRVSYTVKIPKQNQSNVVCCWLVFRCRWLLCLYMIVVRCFICVFVVCVRLLCVVVWCLLCCCFVVLLFGCLVVGCWLLVCGLLVVGCWSLVCWCFVFVFRCVC